MDLIATLKTKLETLPSGDHAGGLKAVLIHIETAFRHLMRGQQERDGQAFTDSIYRANQAFEGSVKEAYRVLAGKNPRNVRPFDIESYLDEHGVFRERVLEQFTIYRTKWRNPSTHDYTLSFDQSEAFLAIVTVSAFACVLIDQISERLAFDKSSKDASEQLARGEGAIDTGSRDLLEIVAGSMLIFHKLHYDISINTESQLIGSVMGFFSVFASFFKVSASPLIAEGRPERCDILVEHNNEKVMIDLKLSANRPTVTEGAVALENASRISGISKCVLYAREGQGKIQIWTRPFDAGVLKIVVPVYSENEDHENSNNESVAI